jgi:cobalamin biosynthesis protein CobD/CbiB
VSSNQKDSHEGSEVDNQRHSDDNPPGLALFTVCALFVAVVVAMIVIVVILLFVTVSYAFVAVAVFQTFGIGAVKAALDTCTLGLEDQDFVRGKISLQETGGR